MTGYDAYEYLIEAYYDSKAGKQMTRIINRAVDRSTNRIKFSDLPGNGRKPLPPMPVYDKYPDKRIPILITDSAVPISSGLRKDLQDMVNNTIKSTKNVKSMTEIEKLADHLESKRRMRRDLRIPPR